MLVTSSINGNTVTNALTKIRIPSNIPVMKFIYVMQHGFRYYTDDYGHQVYVRHDFGWLIYAGESVYNMFYDGVGFNTVKLNKREVEIYEQWYL